MTEIDLQINSPKPLKVRQRCVDPTRIVMWAGLPNPQFEKGLSPSHGGTLRSTCQLRLVHSGGTTSRLLQRIGRNCSLLNASFNFLELWV